MTRNLLFSLMLWLLEVILVASFVSDRWTRELQRAEDQMMIRKITSVDRMMRALSECPSSFSMHALARRMLFGNKRT